MNTEETLVPFGPFSFRTFLATDTGCFNKAFPPKDTRSLILRSLGVDGEIMAVALGGLEILILRPW